VVGLSEADVEELALDCLRSLGWAVARGRDVAPDEAGAERDDYGQAVLERRLRSALARLNPGVPEGPRQDAARKITHPGAPCWRPATGPFTAWR